MPLDVATIVQTLMQQRDSLSVYIWTIVRDVQLVEDTLQELSILAVQKGGEIEDASRLPAWFRRAVRFNSPRPRTPLPSPLGRLLKKFCWVMVPLGLNPNNELDGLAN